MRIRSCIRLFNVGELGDRLMLCYGNSWNHNFESLMFAASYSLPFRRGTTTPARNLIATKAFGRLFFYVGNLGASTTRCGHCPTFDFPAGRVLSENAGARVSVVSEAIQTRVAIVCPCRPRRMNASKGGPYLVAVLFAFWGSGTCWARAPKRSGLGPFHLRTSASLPCFHRVVAMVVQ